MYVDNQLVVSDTQAFSSDAASTNTIDTGNITPKNDWGAGEPMVMVVQVDVAADFTTGDETYEFQVIQSANADLSSPDILAQRTITAANLSAGSMHFLSIPPGAQTKRYLGAFFNGGGTTPTITATIFFAPATMIPVLKTYAKGYTIS